MVRLRPTLCQVGASFNQLKTFNCAQQFDHEEALGQKFNQRCLNLRQFNERKEQASQREVASSSTDTRDEKVAKPRIYFLKIETTQTPGTNLENTSKKENMQAPEGTDRQMLWETCSTSTAMRSSSLAASLVQHPPG